MSTKKTTSIEDEYRRENRGLEQFVIYWDITCDLKNKIIHMKKLYILFFFTLMASALNAQVIVSEDFNYPTSGGLDGQNGGLGWSSSWSLISGTDQLIVDDTISNYRSGFASGTYLNMTYVAAPDADPLPPQIRYSRDLPVAINDDNDDVYWLAFTMQVDQFTASNSLTNVILSDNGSGSENFQFIFGQLFNGRIGFGANGGTTVSTDLDPTQENWLVFKISLSAANNDTIRFFANPDPTVEPQDGDELARFVGGKLNNAQINSIVIRAESAAVDANVSAFYDDIYLGNTYLDIVPNPSTVEEIPRYVPVSESFDCTAGDGLNAQGGAGDGWAEAWELLSGPDQLISSTSIANPELLVTTGGNSLLIDATLGSTRMSRRLENRYIDHGQNYWFGFNTNFSNADLDGGELLVILADTTFAGSGGAGQPVAFGKRNTADELGIMSFGSSFTSISAQVGANGSYWMVAKLEMTGDGDADTVRLFINPDPSVEPEAGTEAATWITNSLNNGFQEIGFKHSSGATQALVDDFYLALDYSDIVPDDLVSISFPNSAFENFDYAAGTINGQGIAENGWSGPWQIVSGPDPSIVTDSITNVGLI